MEKSMAKFIFVTGGVVSGLGKGIVAASLGRLLKSAGYRVAVEKFDPYMNVDPGTLNPVQHGEVFVTADGGETDLDLGHYERFIGIKLTKDSSLTSGKLFTRVFKKERKGEYGGKTVQIVSHVTDEIKAHGRRVAKKSAADVVITEIGGTTGDIESQPYIEALRQFRMEEGEGNCAFIHVCLLPYLSASEEFKTKPVQHSVRELQGLGVRPDVVVLRSDTCPDRAAIEKVSLFCSVPVDCVVPSVTVKCLYDAPEMLRKNGLYQAIARVLSLDKLCNLSLWNKKIRAMKTAKKHVKIAVVGKYVALKDSYISLVEAIRHAAGEEGVSADICWVDSQTLTPQNVQNELSSVNGIVVPGGFGLRGVEGMISACRFARENDVPYLGICLGMQIAVIEFARNVVGIASATSGEFISETHKTEGQRKQQNERQDALQNGVAVIDVLPDKKGKKIGGTLRLGEYPCLLQKGTKIAAAYGGAACIRERHRHRYEFNAAYSKTLQKGGLTIGGTSPDGRIVETVELADRSFFVGVQFHPEFSSTPENPNALFCSFLAAAKNFTAKNFTEAKNFSARP